mmetsp:Transcript_87652/g.246214  ORF Transcript_87652/g.246214 Transcript_87652/m.246214 type:complete len:224 (+) Transcript_87652:67-738(+)
MVLLPLLKAIGAGPSTPNLRALLSTCLRNRHLISAYNPSFPAKISSSETRIAFSWWKANLISCSYFPFTMVTPASAAKMSALLTTFGERRVGNPKPPCIFMPPTRNFCFSLQASSKPAKRRGAVSTAPSLRFAKSFCTSSSSWVSTIITFGMAKSSDQPRFVPRSSRPYPTSQRSGRSGIPVTSASGQFRLRFLLKRQHVKMSFSVCVEERAPRRCDFISCMV